ncbi:hypothetical protein MPSI1_001078 [Malassezia psittaci]|uniref:Uncharacterized protein n=1 Tax=Malassezia psittaci TaxID=1821823 RepID=A0AAF0JD95_9BASI|nr:hypothetical protein MPSI1_001078 [Malassezia psittaci]
MAKPLAQLVEDYFDEEQCMHSKVAETDDAALDLMDVAYTSERPPNGQGANSVEKWKRQYQTNESISSTPLGPWADALPLKFNTVWDLLAFEPNGVLCTESPWRSPEQEFWMPERSLGSAPNYPRDEQTRPAKIRNSSVISEGTRVKYSTTFLNSIYNLVYELCDETIDSRPQLRLNNDNAENVVCELVSKSFNSKKMLNQASDKNPSTIKHTLGLWYRFLWLKLYLLRSLLPLSLEPRDNAWAILLEQTTKFESVVTDELEAEEASKLVSTRQLRTDKGHDYDDLSQLSELLQDTLSLKTALQMQNMAGW